MVDLVLLAADNAQGQLEAAVPANATVFEVIPYGLGDPGPFPQPVVGVSFFIATITDSVGVLREVVHVIEKVGTTFTVVRGQEGTIALDWPAGTKIENLMTSGSLDQFIQVMTPTTGTGPIVRKTGAVLIDPDLQGEPTAATPDSDDDSQRIATTAFFYAALAATASTGTGLFVRQQDPDILNAHLSGDSTAATQAADDASTKIATTAFVAEAIGDLDTVGSGPLVRQLNSEIISPDLTGQPTADTPAVDDDSRRVATTAYVNTAISDVESTGTGLLVRQESPELLGEPTAPTPAADDDSTKIATTAYVNTAIGDAPATGTGLIVRQTGPNIIDPDLQGEPTATTPATDDDSTRVATTAYVNAAIDGSDSTGTGLIVRQQSPTIIDAGLTGTPTAPTPAVDDNSTKVATTAYVNTAIDDAESTGTGLLVRQTDPDLQGAPTSTTPAANDDSTRIATTEYVNAAIEDVTSTGTGLLVRQNEPTIIDADLTGTPTAPTPATDDDTTKIATTAFVNNAIDGADSTGTGLFVRQTEPDIIDPNLQGEPTATTATLGDDSTRVATTAFVQDAIDGADSTGTGLIVRQNAPAIIDADLQGLPTATLAPEDVYDDRIVTTAYLKRASLFDDAISLQRFFPAGDAVQNPSTGAWSLGPNGDPTTAINEWIDACITTKRWGKAPAGDYLVPLGDLIWKWDNVAGLFLFGEGTNTNFIHGDSRNGKGLFRFGTHINNLTYVDPDESSITLTAPTTTGSTVVKLSDTSLFFGGEYLVFADQTQKVFYHSGSNFLAGVLGQSIQIKRVIDSEFVELEGITEFDYNAGTWVGYLHNPVQDISIRDMRLSYDPVNSYKGGVASLLTVNGYDRLTLENIDIHDGMSRAFSFQNGMMIEMHGIRFAAANVDSGLMNFQAWCNGGHVSDVTQIGGIHAVGFGGHARFTGAAHIDFHDFDCQGTFAPINSHWNMRDCSFTRMRCIGLAKGWDVDENPNTDPASEGGAAITMRGYRGIVVKDCYVSRFTRAYMAFSGTDHLYQNNIADQCGRAMAVNGCDRTTVDGLIAKNCRYYNLDVVVSAGPAQGFPRFSNMVFKDIHTIGTPPQFADFRLQLGGAYAPTDLKRLGWVFGAMSRNGQQAVCIGLGSAASMFTTNDWLPASSNQIVDQTVGPFVATEIVLGAMAATVANVATFNETVTVTIATPAVMTWATAVPPAGIPFVLTTTGLLPTGLVNGNTYFVSNVVGLTSNLSATKGGAAINTTGAQSGVHNAFVPGITASYQPNSRLTLAGGTFASAASLKVLTTQLVNFTVSPLIKLAQATIGSARIENVGPGGTAGGILPGQPVTDSLSAFPPGTTVRTPATVTGNTNGNDDDPNATFIITNVNTATLEWAQGMPISDTTGDIPPGTYVQQVNPDGVANTLLLTQPAVGSTIGNSISIGTVSDFAIALSAPATSTTPPNVAHSFTFNKSTGYGVGDVITTAGGAIASTGTQTKITVATIGSLGELLTGTISAPGAYITNANYFTQASVVNSVGGASTGVGARFENLIFAPLTVAPFRVGNYTVGAVPLNPVPHESTYVGDTVNELGFLCDYTTGSPNIADIKTTFRANLNLPADCVGLTVTASGFPPGTTILSIAGRTAVLSANCTKTGNDAACVCILSTDAAITACAALDTTINGTIINVVPDPVSGAVIGQNMSDSGDSIPDDSTITRVSTGTLQGSIPVTSAVTGDTITVASASGGRGATFNLTWGNCLDFGDVPKVGIDVVDLPPTTTLNTLEYCGSTPGMWRIVRFSRSITIVDNPARINLNRAGSSILTEIGDIFAFLTDSNGVANLMSYVSGTSSTFLASRTTFPAAPTSGLLVWSDGSTIMSTDLNGSVRRSYSPDRRNFTTSARSGSTTFSGDALTAVATSTPTAISVPVALATATLCTCAGTTLTVGGTITGTWAVGQTVSGGSVISGAVITALGTGTGGAGTYTIDRSVTVASNTPMTGTISNVYTRQQRVGSLSTSGISKSVGWETTTPIYINDPGYFSIRFSWETYQTGAAFFAGIWTGGSMGSTNPTNMTNTFGVGANGGSSPHLTIRRFIDDGAQGGGSSSDFGANFPSNTSLSDFYEVQGWWNAGMTRLWLALMRTTSAGAIFTGTQLLTPVIHPDLNAPLKIGLWGTTSTVGVNPIMLALHQLVIEQ